MGAKQAIRASATVYKQRPLNWEWSVRESLLGMGLVERENGCGCFGFEREREVWESEMHGPSFWRSRLFPAKTGTEKITKAITRVKQRERGGKVYSVFICSFASIIP